MTGYHSFIGYPWIIDCLAKYDSAAVKQKPVPGQVIEFLRMPDQSVSLEDCQHPEAVINISDQKYYIKAVITKEAQQALESEDEHFTLADIKNKIIILKKFSVCFTAVEDLIRCEFYLTVQHFSVLPMETNTVDILNCNMDPGVRKKIKELWQAQSLKNRLVRADVGLKKKGRQTFLSIPKKGSYPCVNCINCKYMKKGPTFTHPLTQEEFKLNHFLTYVSLTQLLMIASEEKFSALKSTAEQCLELDTFSTQVISPQSRTFWSLERKRNEQSTETFVIPVGLLLISPHEETILEQMSDYRDEGQFPSEPADTSEGDHFSQSYSTALSTLSEDPVDEGPSSQYGNPWNNLQSLCVSVPTSYDSQPKCSPSVSQKSRGSEVGSDADSITPDIFTSDADVSISDPPDGKNVISPLMFSEHSSNPLEPTTSKPQTDHASSNTSPNCGQGLSSNTSTSSLNIIPLTQNSPLRSVSVASKADISPVKTNISEMQHSPASKRDMSSLNDESNRRKSYSLVPRKALKRKQTSEDLESTLSVMEQEEPVIVENQYCVSSTVSPIKDFVTDNEGGVQAAAGKLITRREAAVPVSDTEKNNRKSEKYIKICITNRPENQAPIKKRIQAHKPRLQFVVNPKILTTKNSADQHSGDKCSSTSKDCIQEAPSKARHGQSSFQAKVKGIEPVIAEEKTELVHSDGTPFQYTYKSPSEDLCMCLNAIQIPADLCDWAAKMLSEAQERVL